MEFYICCRPDSRMSKTKYNRLKVELAEAGKLNAELAKYLKVHVTTVSDWCTNTNQPSIQNLYRISEFLRIDVRKLLMPTRWNEETMLTQAAEEDPVYFKPPKKTQKASSASKKTGRSSGDKRK